MAHCQISQEQLGGYKVKNNMKMRITLTILMLAGLLWISCSTKLADEIKDRPFKIDSDLLLQDLCECYANNGYKFTIIDESCSFGIRQLPYSDWKEQVSLHYIDSVYNDSSYVKLLFEYDPDMGKEVKTKCFEKQIFPRSGSKYYRLRPTKPDINNESSIYREINRKVNNAQSDILGKVYSSYNLGNSTLVPHSGELPKLVILSINFEVDSVAFDPIIVGDKQLAKRIASDIGKLILENKSLSKNITYLSYPLNYWESDQLE